MVGILPNSGVPNPSHKMKKIEENSTSTASGGRARLAEPVTAEMVQRWILEAATDRRGRVHGAVPTAAMCASIAAHVETLRTRRERPAEWAARRGERARHLEAVCEAARIIVEHAPALIPAAPPDPADATEREGKTIVGVIAEILAPARLLAAFPAPQAGRPSEQGSKRIIVVGRSVEAALRRAGRKEIAVDPGSPLARVTVRALGAAGCTVSVGQVSAVLMRERRQKKGGAESAVIVTV